jgi:hypothetical protein
MEDLLIARLSKLGHHAIASRELSAGAVKARRPRVSGVGAKRRALHGAEHSSRLEPVMAGRQNLQSERLPISRVN